MARLLVRLRLRLLANTLQLGVQQAVSFLLAVLLGFVAGVLVAALAVVSIQDAAWSEGVTLGFAVLWIGWIVLPAIGFASDDTLDPRRFGLLPLSPRELMPGLLLGALIGVGPAAALLAVSGVVVGAGRISGSGLVIAVAALAGLVGVVTSVAWSRALLAIASDVLSSRRGKDVTTLGSLALLAAIVIGPQLLGRTGVGFSEDALATTANIASWTPGGLAGSVIGHAVAGELLGAAVRLLGVVATIVVALVLWGAALRRQQRVSPVQAAGGRGTSSLYPRAIAWLPRTRLTAVAVRYLRTLIRDSRVRSQALSTTFVIFPLYVLSATAIPGPSAPLYASYLVIPFGVMAANQLGHEGPALWLHELTGEDTRSDLLGRDLALSLGALPLAALGAIGLAAAFDAWASLPVALLLSLAVLLVLLGVSNAAAVLTPYPIPEDPASLFGGANSGVGFLQGLTAMVVLILHGVLILPVLVPALVVESPTLRLVVVGLGVVYGAALMAGGTAVGISRARGRGPELLSAIDPRRS